MNPVVKSFVISDSHFSHNNIIRYCGRPFRNVEEMNLELIQRWNSVVSLWDTVYHCGDVSFHARDTELRDIVSQLNGTKYLIRGNHDRMTRKKYLECGFVDVYDELYLEYKGKKILIQHIPNLDMACEHYDVYIHGHTHDRDPDWDTPSRFNACVEKINYTPIDLDDVLSHIEKKKFYNRVYGK